MAWEVIFSARSTTDLEQIVRYIARDDPAAAERFGLKLIAQAELLADAPEMGPRLPQRPATRFFSARQTADALTAARLGSYLFRVKSCLIVVG